MANSHPITSFPADIDRDYFGAWLSGFTDGEGCFQLITIKSKKYPPAPAAQFLINLRKDDLGILTLIQSYFSCGRLYIGPRPYTGKVSPLAAFRVRDTTSIVNTVIPHFERFPLLAKKKADFEFFKQGVKLIHTVSNRPRKNPWDSDSPFRWTEDYLHQFYDIQDTLHEQRQYRD